jgi:hypothetical protein
MYEVAVVDEVAVVFEVAVAVVFEVAVAVVFEVAVVVVEETRPRRWEAGLFLFWPPP